MNNPPPKGYKIWEHGQDDIVPEGALALIGSKWYPSNRIGLKPDPSNTYAIPITDNNNDWTPMPGCGPGGRLPTEKDGEWFNLTLRDKDGTYFVSENWKRSNFPPNTVAWWKRKRLKPWNPTEPEKVERVEYWTIQLSNGNYFGYRYSSKDIAEKAAELHNGSRVVHLREVLPGDPTPEDVREVINELRMYGCNELADKLEGK